MFRDLKEYQEIAKIYADKVSKPENLEERRGSSSAQLAQNRKDAFASKPNTSTYQSNRDKLNKQRTELNKGRAEKQFSVLKPKPRKLEPGQTSVRKRGGGAPQKEKPMPSTAEIRAKNPNVVPGTRVNEVGAQGGGKPSEGNFKKDFPDKKPEAKPKKMHSIEKKNRARLGDAKVDALKAKNKDFQAMKKGGMSKDDFIKKYPKSITAQKAKGLRDHTEWDAYDMVLEYLFSTEQVESLEEANYVMMEMDQNTIGEIVKEVKEALIDEGMLQPYIKPSMPLLKDKRTGEYMTIDGKPFDLQKFKDDYNKKKEGNMGKDKPKTGK